MDSKHETFFIFNSCIKEVDMTLTGIDLVCLTSKNEGTLVSLIKDQFASKFIISTNVGGIEYILYPDYGLISVPGDDEVYKQNLLNMLINF